MLAGVLHGVRWCGVRWHEADVYGNVTALLLQELSGGTPFVADLVDLDRSTGTGTFWHCGLAPLEMARRGDQPRATIHSNRQKPLLNEFALRSGRVTLARLSQSRGRHRLVVGGAEMLDEPLPFSGTAGTARFDRPVDAVLDTVLGEGLEHHYGIAYGDHRARLAEYADAIGIPVVEL
jgi:L-fucose isomerase-like protein